MADTTEFFEEFKTSHEVCASHCCICGRKLTDSSSIEYGYEDAPVITDGNVDEVCAAISAFFPGDAAAYLIEKVKVDSPTFSRQLANCAVYYASSLVGTTNASDMIHGIRLLIAMNYGNLSRRLLFKCYNHKIEIDDESNKFTYSGPFNKVVNAHLKAHFKGRWNPDEKHWMLQGDYISCMALLVKSETEELEMPVSPKKSPGKPIVVVKVDQTLLLCPPYTNKFRVEVKKQFGAQWDGHLKQWKVGAEHQDELVELITSIYPDCPVQL
jgi:hypothetical protein